MAPKKAKTTIAAPVFSSQVVAELDKDGLLRLPSNHPLHPISSIFAHLCSVLPVISPHGHRAPPPHLPTLFPSGDCWTLKEPTLRRIWRTIQHNLYDGECYSRSDLTVYASHHDDAVAQFRKKLRRKHTYSVLKILADALNDEMCVPRELAETFAIVEDSITDVTANLTPVGSFVDLHIDIGTHGIAHTAGEGVKLWLLFPPTIENLRKLNASSNRRDLLLRVGHTLEGGFHVFTTSAHLLWSPLGWIHAVLTLQSTLLMGINFTAIEDAPMAALTLSYEPTIEHSMALITACTSGMCSQDRHEREAAAKIWCEQRGMVENIYIVSKSNVDSYFYAMRAAFSAMGECPRCHKPAADHFNTNVWTPPRRSGRRKVLGT